MSQSLLVVYMETRKGLAKPLIGHELPAVDADMLGASCRKLAGSDEITQYHS